MTQSLDGTAARMIEVATSQLGTVEGPNNETKYGATMHSQNLPWCGSFLNWCAIVAKVPAVPNVVGTIAGAASFKKNKQWFEKDPKAGDFAFFDFVVDGKTVIQHIGLVVKVQGDGLSIITIEGNTSGNAGPHGQANGGEVMMKTRKLGPHDSFVVGFGRPNYKESNEKTT